MNIIFNIDSKQEILLGCTKIEITESRRSNGFYSIYFHNNRFHISFPLERMRYYPMDSAERKCYNDVIFDTIKTYLTSNIENLVWSEFEEEVYNKYKSLNEK